MRYIIKLRLKLVLVNYVFFLSVILSFSQERTLITDFSSNAGNRRFVMNNYTPVIKKALEYCAKKDSSILVFPKGRYDFWPDFSIDGATIGILMEKLKNVTIDGDGSEFIYHGNMVIASLNNCENIKLQNFTVDWDRPFIYQGEYLAVTDQYIDVKFDHIEYQYLIEDSLFYLTGEAWKARPSGWFNLYDKDKKEIVYRTYDSNNRSVFSGKAAEISPGVVRFFGKPSIKPDSGTIETFYAGTYITDCIQIFDCKNTFLKNITVYHGLSTGIYGRRSENITMDNVNMSANEKKGRVFSVIADASHFTNCKGLIKIENCSHTGQGDDWINIRGQNIPIATIIDKFTIVTTRPRQTPITRDGDEIWFINKESVQRGGSRTVKNIEPVITDGKTTGYKLIFTEAIPNNVKSGDFFENKTWNPGVEIRNCQILKKHRARGILITTPQKVVIENNYFRTGNAAILVAGDVDFWFESGAHNDLTICNNVFEDCNTSGGEAGQNAIITILPSHKPASDNTEPYHKNIHIKDNIFKTFDIPLVKARSVRNLTFINNQIIKTSTYKPFSSQRSSFLLDGCRDVEISGNIIDKAYLTRTIEMDHMRKSDVKAEGFKILLK